MDKKTKIGLFREEALAVGHEVVQYDYFDGDELCTTIVCDFTDEVLKIQNYTDRILKTAFGVSENPSWEEFLDFLEERCVPRSRDNVRGFLAGLGLFEYDPIEIVEKTQGRMAEDAQWLKIKRL